MRTRPPRLQRPPRGAALATAMFFLVVITLLGVAAMRAGQVDLRLALNEESRVNAVQSAQSLLDALLNDRDNITIEPGSGYVQNCFVAAALDAASLATRQGFECPNGSATPVLPSGTLSTYAYTLVVRENVNGADFAPVSALRRGDSGERFRLASFTLTAGYDRTQASRASTSTDTGNFGAAEVSQGTFVKVDTVDGLVIQ
ncbi:MAG TPA: pilus assembly PilX N-terminal domain-containing protein [Nevskiaceae bacterium]|nr:pilus assembly PilX N-terminal domain-containing protein [Nevskiaceae bacterium]